MVRTIRKIGGFLRWRFDQSQMFTRPMLLLNELSWPRVVRSAFSDRLCRGTGVHGRGTEE
jgi:hypothetical protein